MRGRVRYSRAVLGGIIVSAVVLTILAGCGAIGEEYKVIQWYTNYFEKYYPRWMDDFSREHADEHVKIDFRAMVSDAQQKVYTMLISHTLSDVIMVGNETQALLMENRALEAVPEGYIERDDFMPLTLATHSYSDGQLAAIPHTVGIRPFMYFNREVMEEVGTTVEDVPETYEPYHEWAGKFLLWEVDGKKKSGFLGAGERENAKLLRRPLLLQRGHFLSMVPFMLAYMDPEPDANGESDGSLDDYVGGPPSMRPFRFDTPEFAAGLAEWQKFFISEKGAIADGETDRIRGLTAGTYASCEAGNWIFGEVASVNMQVTSLPHAKGRVLRLPINVGSYGVSTDSKHKELAMEFCKYVSGKERQLDGYYGHGYLPCRFSAWEQIRSDDAEDMAIREKFLGGYGQGDGDFVGVARITRRYHDRMSIYLYVPFAVDREIARRASTDRVDEEEAASGGGGEGDAEVEAQAMTMAEKYGGEMEKLARDVAEMTGQEVTVVLQGTPPEMLKVRSSYSTSPVEVYVPHLGNGVYMPVHKMWDRLTGDVMVRAQQFVTSANESDRMTPEEAAKWCQEEAEAIAAGTK